MRSSQSELCVAGDGCPWPPLSMHACTFDTDHNSYNNAEGLINNPGLAFCSCIILSYNIGRCLAWCAVIFSGGDGRRCLPTSRHQLFASED